MGETNAETPTTPAPRKGSAGRPRKHGASRLVSVRLGLDQYDVLKRTAAALGTDLAPLLSVVIANSVPALLARLERHEADVVALKAALERKGSA